MVEQLFRLIPRWILPALLAGSGWLFFVHSYVSEIFFSRMTVPLIKKTMEEADIYAKYNGISIQSNDVSMYLRCIYGTVYATDDFKIGYSIYIATGTYIGSEALDQFKERLDSVVASNVCGVAPWQTK